MGKGDETVKTGAGRGYLAPGALEWLSTLAVIVFLYAQSAAFREPEFMRGAGDRYQEAVELKAPMLPEAAGSGRVVEICTRFGGWLPETERAISAERMGACH